MERLLNPEVWIALLTLTTLEIVLGIDNLVFITILSSKLPPKQEDQARTLGLGAAMFTRIALLVSLSWIIRLTAPLFTVVGQEISGRDLLLIGGGLFLLAKGTFEIHDRLEGEEGEAGGAAPSLIGVVVQITLLDAIFSLDSVITAVGMARDLFVMVAAVVIAVGIMIVASEPISEFVKQHPTIKVLALSFLLLIGFSLVAEGLELTIPKGYIYFAMGFSVFVEMLNLRLRTAAAKPVELRRPYIQAKG